MSKKELKQVIRNLIKCLIKYERIDETDDHFYWTDTGEIVIKKAALRDSLEDANDSCRACVAKLTQRERDLIISALDKTPDDEETRALMERIES